MGKEEHRDEYRNDAREEKSGGSSRLGREAKIGVTVIAVLLVALGVAVVMRMNKPGEDDKQVAAAADRDIDKDKPGGPNKIDAMFKDSRSKPIRSGGSSPTIISAKAISGKPPRSTTADFDPWKVASNHGNAKRTGGGSASSPPLIPDPPKPAQEDRRGRYALDPPVLKGVGDIRPPRVTDSDARGKDSPRHSSKSRASRTDTNGFASTSDLPPPLPPYREKSRYENPTPQQPGTTRGGSPYSIHADRTTEAMTVGQSDGGDWRRESQASRRHKRSAPAARYNDLPRRDDGKYEVQPNDSYWTISERLYGTGAYFKALAQQNRGKDANADRLQPGALILAPTVAELEKSYPDMCPKPSRREALQSQAMSRASTVSSRNQYGRGRSYTVVEGDTLFNIARYELGKASRWAEIYDLNRDMLGKDFNYLTPGTRLAMPKGEKSNVIARPLDSGYRR